MPLRSNAVRNGRRRSQESWTWTLTPHGKLYVSRLKKRHLLLSAASRPLGKRDRFFSGKSHPQTPPNPHFPFRTSSSVPHRATKQASEHFEKLALRTLHPPAQQAPDPYFACVKRSRSTPMSAGLTKW